MRILQHDQTSAVLTGRVVASANYTDDGDFVIVFEDRLEVRVSPYVQGGVIVDYGDADAR